METTLVKQRPLVGVGVLVIQEGKILLGKRLGSHGFGEWSFPGGHLELGETVEACAMRELAEETGLKASSVHLGPWTNDVMAGDKHYVTLFVFVNQFKGEPKALELQNYEEWQWFDWNALPSPVFGPIRSLIDKVGAEGLRDYCHVLCSR